MQAEEVFVLVFIVSILAGVFIVFMGLRQRSQQLEMRHRERMAMIERGQIPLERDIHGLPGRRAVVRSGGASSIALSFGIIVVGIGLALMSIISIAGDSPEIGVGIGGAIVILGTAFIVRSIVVRPEGTTTRTESIVPPGDDAV